MRFIDYDKLIDEFNKMCTSDCGCCDVNNCPVYNQKDFSLYEHDIRVIDEFANKLKHELNKYDFWKYDIVSEGYIEEKDVPYDWIIDEIAEKLKENKRCIED